MPRPTKYDGPAQVLRQRIDEGRYRAGQRLPSEAELCREFGLSRSCIRKALALLRDEGLVSSAHGTGHFVTRDRPAETPVRDTALVMAIKFAEWGTTHVACLLYNLLEQHVVQGGARFTHIPLASGARAEDIARQVEQSGAPRVVVDLAAHEVLTSDVLLWHLLEDVGCRVVTTTFRGPTFAAPFDQVCVDWAAGTRRAVEYLIGRGHRRIVFAGYDGVDWSDDRRGAFLAAMHKAGRWQYGEPAPCVAYPGPIRYDRPGHPESGIAATAAEHLLRVLGSEPADGVLCANDALAMELRARAPRRSLPELVGYDNSVWAMEHSVCSVAMDLRRHADAVMELLARPATEARLQVGVPTMLVRRA